MSDLTGRRPTDPWGTTRPVLVVGSLVRMPDKRVFVVGSVGPSRARIFPLTPVPRVIHVPSKLDRKRKVEKEVYETGDPLDVSPHSQLSTVNFMDLTDAEFSRLTQYISTGGEFNQ